MGRARTARILLEGGRRPPCLEIHMVRPSLAHPVIALAAATALLAAATGAQAHAHLVSATPAANAAVAAPKILSLTFSEKLEPKFSGVDLMTANGKPVAVKSSVAAKDRKTITAALSAPLAAGSYMVMWHVVSADGHKMKGDFSFTVH
jgi:methionine-rich copper-binding protein CopC